MRNDLPAAIIPIVDLYVKWREKSRVTPFGRAVGAPCHIRVTDVWRERFPGESAEG